MTDFQRRTFFGFDSSGGKKGTRYVSRSEGSLSIDALEALKALRVNGQKEITCTQAAKILGGRSGRFSTMVADGRLMRGKDKLMTLDGLISWVAKGIAQKDLREREGIGSQLEWLNE